MSHWVPLYICSDRPDVASLATEKAETAEDKNGLRRVVRSHLLGLPSRNWGPFPESGGRGTPSIRLHRYQAELGLTAESRPMPAHSRGTGWPGCILFLLGPAA